MKNTFRRILSIALAILMIFALLSLAACGKEDNRRGRKPSSNTGSTTNSEQNKFIDALGGVSETFEGAISGDSYASSIEAAEAFVVEELANGRANVSVVNSKELSSSEIKAANIPADLIEGCDAVEEVEVEYSVIDMSGLDNRSNVTSLASETLDKTTKVKVYVIKFGVDWKYFSPMPVTGDTISKSYYDSVFNAEKYKNCTFEMTNEATADISADGQSMTMIMKINQVIKHADGKVYLEQHMDVTSNGENMVQSVYAYMETVGGAIKCYVKTSENGSWMEADLSTVGFTSLEQLTPFYDQYLDYTYFTKTDFGFALEDENARKYFTTALMGALEGMESLIDPNKMNLDMYAEYYVCDGVLSGMRVDADVDMTISAAGSSGTLKETVTTVTKCTNYGTTVVEKPFAE